MAQPNAAEGAGSTALRPHQSVAWRMILPVPICVALAIGLVWFTMPRVVADMAVHDATVTNQEIVGQFKTIRGYYSEFIVNKVLKDPAFSASHDHKGKDHVIPVPATFTHDLSALLANRGISMSLYSHYPFPGRKDRQLDEFQEAALSYLVANPKEVFSRAETRDGKQVVRVAMADTMSAQSCISCHNSDPESPKRDWKLGDVRGVMEVDSIIDPQLAHASTLSQYVVGAAGAIGLILMALTLFVTRGVTRSLGGMVGAMKQLAAGQFDVVLPGLGRKDEVGAMAHAVELFKVKAIERARREADEEEAKERAADEARKAEMRQIADGFEHAVGSIVIAVSSASVELEAAAGTLAHNAETTEKMSAAVAHASEEASTNVESVSAGAQELETSVSEVSRRATESSQIAGEAVRQAERTDARIAALSDAAARIGDVVKLITAIAEQTNLLALNATIEAARAGEAGRGFAVVAAEVKTLATQTAKATDEIGAQITEMQNATRDSVAAIKEIGATIARISEIAVAIAAAVEEQSATTGEIARNLGNASASTLRVASTISDVSRAATETGTASSHVLGSARMLANEGSKLKLEVDRFLEMVRAA
ncbi:MAG TPA: methyl-accepting chemotaxis protein [Pseudolabrys sp.]|nr:methyl-accepting chemotaxis protein [Pseudolabrys sp.]